MAASIRKRLEKTGQLFVHANFFMSSMAMFTATTVCLLPNLFFVVFFFFNNVLIVLVLKQIKG